MRILRDRHGVAAVEFALIGVFFFTLLFGIFDVGRYAITVISLRSLASEVGRAIAINCYNTQMLNNASPSTCTTNPLSSTQEQTFVPFLFLGGLTPTVTAAASGGKLTITATQSGFTMLMPFFPASMKSPSVNIILPY